MICKRCGCTPERPCLGGCAWMLPDLCTACLTADELAIDRSYASMLEGLRAELEQSRFERFLLAVVQGMVGSPHAMPLGGSDEDFIVRAMHLALGLCEASEPLDDRADVAEAADALNDLWLWATESRTHLTTDPVPDGLGAKVLAALAKSDGQ